MANKKITELMAGTPTRDSLIESATDVGGTMVSRKFKVGAVADVNNVQIASEYDDTATYNYGAYCIKDGVLYRCITAISVAEAWDSTHWTAVMVTGEFRRVVELTSAQYTALSSAEKNNGTLYVITDEETTADDIPYSAGVSVADKLDNVPTFDTLTTGDNNKLLGVSVSGSDISVGAIGVKQKAISFQSSISGNSDKGYTISDILTQANVSSDKLISIEFGGARALTAWSEVRCTTWLSISGGTHGFYFHNFGTGGNAEFSFLVTYFE